LNTNGSLPETLRRLFDAGLDSVRISFNSAREPCYRAYFRPRGYRFADVLESVRLALQNKVFVSINYLNLPGFTDTPEEFDALTRLLERHPVDMIQWRNLNFDPLRYWQLMAQAAPLGDPLGMDRLLEALRRHFPQLRHGYFNPPRETFRTNVSGAVAQD
jgi:pyruvate-formate lyase-activating enzyme